MRPPGPDVPMNVDGNDSQMTCKSEVIYPAEKRALRRSVKAVGVGSELGRFRKMCHRRGSPQDSMSGFALHRELELDVQAGIPTYKVLQNATLNAARIMKLDGDLGSIAAGKLADVTLVNGDPVANISDIRKTALVMKDGVLYRPEELYSAVGVAPSVIRQHWATPRPDLREA